MATASPSAGMTTGRMGVIPMGATAPRSGFALLLSAVLLAGFMAVSVVPVGASDDEDESGVGMDALQGLWADEGGGDPSSPPTGDLNDPLAGGSGGSSDESETEETGAEPGTTEGWIRRTPLPPARTPCSS